MRIILVEIAIALVVEAILEIARNTVITKDPFTIETSIGPFHIQIDSSGLSTWYEWTVAQTQGCSN